MQLETPEGFWNATDCEAEINEVMAQLQRSGITQGTVSLFPASATADTVWHLHALTRLNAIPMPYAPTATAEHLHMLEELRDQRDPNGPHKVSSTSTFLRLTTTGTTGTPKPVDLTRHQIECSADASAKRLGCTPEDRWLCCLPLHHIAGLSILFRTARLGATAVLHPNFDPNRVSRAIDEENIHLISLVPTMLRRILDTRSDRPFPPSLRVILLGGAPCPSRLLDRCRAIRAPVALTWGMTETASQVATRRPGDLRDAPDVGEPLDGLVVQETKDGLLRLKGAIAPGGDFITGDRGTLDDQGRVIIFGRGESLIISGGENIDPLRIEHALLEHTQVEEAVVVSRPDVEWGERPVAFVVATRSADLKTWLKSKLHRHEQPAEIHHISILPRNEMGKIDRRALVVQARTSGRIDKL